MPWVTPHSFLAPTPLARYCPVVKKALGYDHHEPFLPRVQATAPGTGRGKVPPMTVVKPLAQPILNIHQTFINTPHVPTCFYVPNLEVNPTLPCITCK